MGAAENALKLDAVKLMKAYGIFAWPQNNIRVPGRKFIGKKGVPDVIGVQRNGPSWWVEAKGPETRQSPEQKIFQEEVERRGHIYVLMRDISDLKERLLSERTKQSNRS